LMQIDSVIALNPSKEELVSLQQARQFLE